MAIDIDQSFYNTGTASVENGGTIVTGQGTQWISSIRANDIFGTHKGDGVRILSVESNTSLTLAYPWTGETQATAPYEVQFTPYDTGYYPAVRQLLQTMASGNIEAFAALIGEPNRVPIFTGPGAMDLVDPSTFGLQDPNDSLAKLAALTLAARQILQTDESGALKALTLAENKALVTNADKDVEQIDLGALGRALLALANGTSAQYVQGDGTLQAKSDLPISTAMQTALDGKASLSGATFTGSITFGGGLGANQNALIVREFGVQRWGVDFIASDGSLRFQTFISGNWNGPSASFLPDKSVQFFGNISKAGGTFDIDHPKDPFNKNLRHGFVEAPEYINIYRGVVDLEGGQMSVDIDAAFGMSDGTFAALNVEVCAFLQTQYGPERVWLEGPADSGKFTIISENPESSATVAFMVTGRRNDPYVLYSDPTCERGTGRFIPEYEKDDF